MLRIREVSQKAQKSVEKSAENIWKCHFFAVTLHPLSHRKTVLESSRKGVLKNFLKKSFQKIWRLQKNALPLHHFRADKTAEGAKNGKREPQGLIK